MRLDERSFREWFIIIIAAIVAIEVGGRVASSGAAQLAYLIAFVLLIIWALFAGEYWWTPLLIGPTSGGYLYFGFKIHLTTLILILAFIGLIPKITFSSRSLYKVNRPGIPIVFYVLPLYLIVRVGLDYYVAQGGLGNMVQILAGEIWPFLFGWLFYRFAKASLIGVSIWLVIICSSLRVLGLLAGMMYNQVLYVPGINYVISTAGEIPLGETRTVGYYLLFNILIVYQAARHIVWRMLFIPMGLLAFYLTLLSGSRFATSMLCFMPLTFFLVARNWRVLLLSLMGVVVIFISINIFPKLLYDLPSPLDRSLSGLIIKPYVVDVQEETEGSTIWHHDLQQEGFKRWSASPETILFGANIKPYRPEDYENIGQHQEEAIRVTASADIGAYESGLWSVLATEGLCGYGLTLILFFALWRDTVKYVLSRGIRTLKDGFIFWAIYSSMFWCVAGYFWGEYPSLEIALMVMAWTLVQDDANAPEDLNLSLKVTKDWNEPAIASFESR